MILETIQSCLLQITDNLGLLEESAETVAEASKMFDVKLANWPDFFEMLFRFLLNFAVIFAIARGIYYTKAKRKDYLFTYMMIGVIIFLLCFTLSSVKLQLGFALGLFAIFGIVKYRTDAIPIKEMTYLFVIIGVSVINALSNKKVSYVELAFANLVIVGISYIMDYVWLLRHESMKQVVYEKIDLITPEHRAELMADLKKRTGLVISRIEIGKINFLRDTAVIYIYYFQSDQINQADALANPNDSEE